MINKFGEFLYSLRKEKGLTQMELADRLGITNKAVSKWETGEAFPETGQLVPLANIFDVTVDELLRGERDNNKIFKEVAPTIIAEPVNPPLKPMTKAESYTTAGAIGLILVGVLILITLAINDINYGIYVSILILCVAIAVFLLVYTALTRKIRSVEMSNDSTEKGKKLAVMLSGGIGIIILSVSILIAMLGFDVEIFVALPVFFAVLIAGIIIVIYSGIQWESFSKSYSLPEDEQPLHGKYKRIEEAVSGVIMLTATAVFLILGFLYNRWHPGWVVFPVGGILCGIVSSIIKAFNK